ncbi:hypothetical protein vseg_004095 [Gypsophila vaccaria]
MKKTYYYNFFPTKQEELAALATNRPYQVTRTLIEIRDDAPPLNVFDPSNPWKIRKRLEAQEVTSGKIRLSHEDVFENIFRYASLESANDVVMGKKVHVKVCDMTDDSGHVMYGPYDDQVFFEKALHDEYVLALHMAMVRNHGLKKGDEIGIFYDAKNEIFYFKCFH